MLTSPIPRQSPMARASRAAKSPAPPSAPAFPPIPEAVLEDVDDPAEGCFVAAPDVAGWIHATFLAPAAPLRNLDHEHLERCHLGVLLTNVPHRRQGRTIIGTAELFDPKGNRWQRERQRQQLEDWFGAVPDAVITLYAPLLDMRARHGNAGGICALVEHELYHLVQKCDRDGEPMFDDETGRPLLELRGHDVEEFVSVVRRYGARATGTEALVQAAQDHERFPLIAAEALDGVCGLCARAAA